MMSNIGGKKIGDGHPPFIIAEMSGNHNQSIETAMKIVEAAARSGVHALKLQTYTPDTITIDSLAKPFLIEASNSPWRGESLYNLYEKAYTPWEWHEKIFTRATELGLMVFSSPFDESSVDFLENLNVPAYKIASFENIHIPLIKKVAATGKPVILSTGMASVAEIDEAVSSLRQNGTKEIVLLKCTSTYPASPEDSNVLTIPHMRHLFNTEVGLSDHTLGLGVSLASIALGATVIERHFTLSRDDGGVDSSFSLVPEEMKMLVEESFKAWQALGSIFYGPSKSEAQSKSLRRSLYVVSDVLKGEEFTCKNLRVIRPGDGMHPRYFSRIIGKKSTVDVKKGVPMQWDYCLS